MAHLYEEKRKIQARLKKIKGQLESVEKSLDHNKECYDVLLTLSAARGALNSLMSELVESHIKEHVMIDAQKPRTPQDKSALELIKLFKTFWK